MLSRFKNSGLRFLWLSVVIIALDQWSKLAIIDTMKLYESIQLLPFFNFTYVHNYGAAFSFLDDAGGWQRWFFALIAISVSALIIWWLNKTPKEALLLPVAFSCVLGGALGNLYDRLSYGYVIDFLDFYIGSAHWPAFNIADSAIFIGAALLIADMLKNEKAKNQQGEK